MVYANANIHRYIQLSTIFGVYISRENANKIWFKIRKYLFFAFALSGLEPVVSTFYLIFTRKIISTDFVSV